MEESELNPEEQVNNKSTTENESDQLSDLVEKEKSLDNSNDDNNADTIKKSTKNDSLFKRILENGFDGITTNPNYKLLALLIILLINLSLFFLVGNLGKTFLKNSGILG